MRVGRKTVKAEQLGKAKQGRGYDALRHGDATTHPRLAELELLAQRARGAVEVLLRLLCVGLWQHPADAMAVLGRGYAPPDAGPEKGAGEGKKSFVFRWGSKAADGRQWGAAPAVSCCSFGSSHREPAWMPACRRLKSVGM